MLVWAAALTATVLVLLWRSCRSVPMRRTLSGKPRVCVVTGAASGIGHATARTLLEAGQQVVATDINFEGIFFFFFFFERERD